MIQHWIVEGQYHHNYTGRSLLKLFITRFIACFIQDPINANRWVRYNGLVEKLK